MKRFIFCALILFLILSPYYLYESKAADEKPEVITFDKTYIDFSERSSITFGKIKEVSGYEILEYGIILSKNTDAVIGDEGVSVFRHNDELNINGQYGIKLKDSYNLIDEGYYTRAYMIYEKNGIRYEEYGEKSVYSRIIPNSEVVELSELSERVASALPGDEFVIKNGTYSDISVSLYGEGRADAPIKIKAETPGQVIFTGKTDITVSGKYLTLSDFRFENTRSDTNILKFNAATGCRITESYFYDIFGETNTFVTCITAKNISQRNRVDHNVFEKTGGGLSVAVGYNEDSLNYDNRADHNYYKDVPAVSDLFPGELNGFEQAGAGAAKTHDHIAPRMIVEDNLFENIIGDKSEVICIKSSENIIRYNTFLNCNMSGPDFRNGGSCVFEGNFCINSKSGIRSYGANQVIKNNYFYNCQRGVELTTTQEGFLIEEGSQYRQSKNVTVEGNVFIYPIACGIKLGSGYNPLSGYTYVPEFTKIKDNLFVVDRAPAIIHSNSVFDDFSGNVVSLSGSGTVGTDSEGFETRKVNLEFDGQIYIPEGMNINKRGLKTPDDVGPTKKWWLELLKNPCDTIKASVEQLSYKPDSYKPSKTEIVLVEGESYNLGNTTGTANYTDMSLNAISENISYSVVDSTVASVSGLNLTAIKQGTTKLVANINCKTAGITVKVIKSSVDESKSNIYANDFESSDSLINFSNPGSVWKLTDGKLTNSGVTKESLRMAIDNSLKLDGDFILGFELTAKPLDDSDVGNVNGSVILGYKENNYPEYYRINFVDDLTSESIISKNNNNVTDCIGIVNINITKNTAHNIEISKTKNKLSILIDGNLAAVTDIPESLSGRVGFGSSKIIEIDNVIVKRTVEPTSPSVKNINITTERTDVEEVKLSFDSLGDVIYKIYKNGMWISDTKQTEFYDNSIKDGIGYSYEILAYNKNACLIGRGTISYTLPEEIDSNLFVISDCRVRTGLNGSYDEDVYILRNKGLSSKERIYCDRVYTFGDELPEEFKNAAYIMTRAEDVYNSYIQSDTTTDFVKFKINKSATVYLLVFPNGHKTNPEWISDNGWIQTGYNLGSFTKIFAKHYKASNESPSTVEIGGFKDKLPMMYSIVIVPEESPQDFFAVTDVSAKTGVDGEVETNVYPVVIGGLKNGCVKYNDRAYTYGEIPEELVNSTYIMTSNNHITNTVLQSGETSDFMQFKINKSATVYIMVAPNKNEISVSTHPWIKDWTLTDYTIDSFTKIYKRHYDVVSGDVVTVSTGGFKGKLPTMYTVVIKPD